MHELCTHYNDKVNCFASIISLNGIRVAIVYVTGASVQY